MGFELPSYTTVVPFFKSIAEFIKIDKQTVYVFLIVGGIAGFLIVLVIGFLLFKIVKSLNCMKRILCCQICCWDPFKSLHYKKMKNDDDIDDDDDDFVMVDKPDHV